jgi:hypothetical protein
MASIEQSKSDTRRNRETTGPQTTFAVSMFALFVVLIGATQLLARDLVLSLAATALFLLAFTIALTAWHRRPRADNDRVTYWDVAGALTFIGICVAALIDPEQLVRVIGTTQQEN